MEDRFFGTPQNPKMEFGRGNHRSAGGFSHGTEASVSMALSKVEDFRDSSIKRKRFRRIQSLPNLKYPKTCWLSSGSRSKKMFGFLLVGV